VEDQWGLCHVDDSFGASLLGNKGTQFLWFADRDEAVDYLLNDYVDLLADSGELDEEQSEQARERFELLAEQASSDGILIDHVNDLSTGLRRIVWFGPLSQLAEIDDEFASALRRYFWSEQESNEDDPEAEVPMELWQPLLDCIDDFLIEGEYS